jgi:ABC-type nitrate/sulfonate/bicarbonate transport system substrate-binding protein
MGAIMKGAKLKVVMVGRAVDFQIWSFDPQVKTFAAAKGQSLAVVSRGGSEEIATLMYLKAKGYPRDFVGFTAIAGPARVAAIVGGSAKFGVLLPQDLPTLGEKGELAKGTMLVDLAKEVHLATGGLVTTDKEIAERRPRARRVVKAMRKATLYVKAFPDATVDILLKRNPGTSRQAMTTEFNDAYNSFNWPGSISAEAGRQELAARGEILGLSADQIPAPEAAYDFSLVAEADRELAAEGWQPTR